MRERDFQAEVIRELRELFPSAVILKNDANYLQGFPDILILYSDTWAALETKISEGSKRQSNQEYYVEELRKMSYASFIWPEIKNEVFDELQRAFGPSRRPRVSWSK